MSHFPHFGGSGSELHRDGDDSQSVSQARARPAIRLDTSLSFASTTSFVAGGGPASPLLGDSFSTAAVASPTLLFQTRDVNTETARQRSLHSLKATHSHSRHDRRTASHSRSMTSTSQALFSQTSCGGLSQKHTQHQSGSNPRRRPPPPQPTDARDQRSLSSNSVSVGRAHRAHYTESSRGRSDGVKSNAASRHRCLVAADAGEAMHRLDLLGSEPTLLTRPSEPRSACDGEDDARGRRGQSPTVSPAPRHAVTLSDDFDGVFSSLAPSELAHGADEEEHHDDRGANKKDEPGHHIATQAPAPRSRSSVLAGGGLEDSDEYDEEDQGEEVARAESGVAGGSHRRRRSSTTPPPRRAFVLSRRYSSADTASEAPQPCADDVPEADAACQEERLEGAGGVEAAAAPRGSTVLVMGGDDCEDEELAAAASAAAKLALQHSAAPTLPVSRLRPGVVVESSDEVQRTVAPATAAVAARSGNRNGDSATSSDESGSMMSPLPRPVHPSAAARREEHRDETARAAARAAGEGATEPPPHRPRALPEGSEGGAVSATMAAAATASTATQDFDGFSMHSGTLPANTTTATAASDAELRAAAAPSAAPPHADGVTAYEHTSFSDETPLNSMMMAASIAGPAASSRTTTTTATTATSSLWLVSGSTPTPLRKLRERGGGDVGSEDGGADDRAAVQEEGLSGAPMRVSPTPPTAVEGLSAGAEGDEEPARCVASGVHAEAAPAHAHSPAARRSALSTPSFSPEPAPPPLQSHASTTPANAAAAAASPGALAEVSDLTPPPVRAEGHTRPTESFRYSTTAAGAAVTAAGGLSSPSSAESARVSEEVKVLVERAQAEVRRTRESLLSTLREHRTSFHLAEPSPTPRDTHPPPQPHVVTVSMSPSAPLTPSRSLLLPAVVDATTPAQAAAVNVAQESTAAAAAAAAPASRTSGEWRAAATTLRPQLRAAADAIERRLRGYDARDHGVLPMETVVRVAYYVVTRRQMPLTTWSLRTAEGAVAATPMRVSMLESNSPLAKTRTGEEERRQHRAGGALLAGTPLATAAAAVVGRGLETPRMQRSSIHAEASSTRYGSAKTDGAPLSSARRCHAGVVRTRAGSRDGGEEELRGRPATCMSPSRTLEHVMAQQRRRAEEELYLHFYFTVLEAFRQVFGERYAWRHLGATNASRHDCPVRMPPRKSRRTTEAPASAGWREGSDAEAPLADIENELNEVAAPLETLFPRLRQQYALTQRERHDGAGVSAGNHNSSSGDSSATTDAAAAAAGYAHRPPPLDVLVYYGTFVASLREL